MWSKILHQFTDMARRVGVPCVYVDSIFKMIFHINMKNPNVLKTYFWCRIIFILRQIWENGEGLGLFFVCIF